MSKIEWTERTWNPTTGCSKVSAGCANCYALRMSWRNQHNPASAGKYAGTTKKTDAGNINFTGQINLLEEVLSLPLSWKKPSLVFVNSMSDLFHEEIPFTFIDAVFSVMADVDRHIYQVLTKRPERLLAFCNWKELQHHIRWHIPSNIWIGVSVENQQAANERIPQFIKVPIAKNGVRFLSCEPLLGSVNLQKIDPFLGSFINGLKSHPYSSPDKPFIDWVIAGGESGPGARPMHPDWVRSLRDQCASAGVAFFFKQWGEWLPIDHADEEQYWSSKKSVEMKPGSIQQYTMLQVGKKMAGAFLDGKVYRQFPEMKGAAI